MVLVIVVSVAVVCAAVLMFSMRGRGRDVSREADRFAAARAMTNRWADDPASAPKPVLDIARQRTDEAPADASDVGHHSGLRG